MASVAAERLMTAEELMALPKGGDSMYELDEGRLVTLSPSGPLSSVVAVNVLLVMAPFVKEHRLGICFGADGGFQLSSNPDTVRAPDVSFVSAARMPAGGIPRRGYWPGAPDLAVEVLSPSNRAGEIWKRIGDLLNAGTRLVWVIDPIHRTAMIIRAGGDIVMLGEDGVLDGEDLLAGFALRLGDVLA